MKMKGFRWRALLRKPAPASSVLAPSALRAAGPRPNRAAQTRRSGGDKH
jgi:hypothetical protein